MNAQDLENIAISTLMDVCKDPTAPPSAKASAARTLAEMCGAIGKHAEKPNKNKAIEDMTAEELEALANE